MFGTGFPEFMTGAREQELLYPEPVASLKIKILNKPMHKNTNELKIFVIIILSLNVI